MQEASQSETAAIAAARSQKALDNLREQQRQMNQQSDNSVNQLAQNIGQRGQQLLQQQRDLEEALESTSRQQGLGQTRQSVRDDAALQELIEAQQKQQRDLKEIEDMLRAIIARGDNEDQRLMSQAQEASRDLGPIREEMQTSNRVLRNGMVNLAVDIERGLESQIAELSQSLQALDPSRADTPSDQIQQAANDAELLRQQIEDLEQQALAFNQAQQAAQQGGQPGQSGNQPGDQPGGQPGDQPGGQSGSGGTPSLRDMREQLQRTQQLAQQIQQQLQEQAQAGGGQQGGQAGRQIGGGDRTDGGDRSQQTGGTIRTDGNNSPIGNARSIRQQLTQQDIEDFLNQPELFRQLLEPIAELEGALRAQAEMDAINNKLFATPDEDIPDEYRDLVQEYYRVLSENQGSANSAQ